MVRAGTVMPPAGSTSGSAPSSRPFCSTSTSNNSSSVARAATRATAATMKYRATVKCRASGVATYRRCPLRWSPCIAHTVCTVPLLVCLVYIVFTVAAAVWGRRGAETPGIQGMRGTGTLPLCANSRTMPLLIQVTPTRVTSVVIVARRLPRDPSPLVCCRQRRTTPCATRRPSNTRSTSSTAAAATSQARAAASDPSQYSLPYLPRHQTLLHSECLAPAVAITTRWSLLLPNTHSSHSCHNSWPPPPGSDACSPPGLISPTITLQTMRLPSTASPPPPRCRETGLKPCPEWWELGRQTHGATGMKLSSVWTLLIPTVMYRVPML